MKSSSRFVVAIHILTMLTYSKKSNLGPQKSDILAKSVNTNPVVIRRILGLLSKAGLIISRSGLHGGFDLEVKPEKIRLLDVYLAVEKKNIFHYHYSKPNIKCIVGRNIQGALMDILCDAEKAMKGVLEKTNIGMILDNVLKNN